MLSLLVNLKSMSIIIVEWFETPNMNSAAFILQEFVAITLHNHSSLASFKTYSSYWLIRLGVLCTLSIMQTISEMLSLDIKMANTCMSSYRVVSEAISDCDFSSRISRSCLWRLPSYADGNDSKFIASWPWYWWLRIDLVRHSLMLCALDIDAIEIAKAGVSFEIPGQDIVFLTT